MQAQIRFRHVTLTLDGETQKDLFQEIAAATEVFGEEVCGLCQSDRIRPSWRVVTKGKQTYEYPEYRCLECGAKLSLGSMIEGGRLFPHRKLTGEGKPDRENGTYGSHRGWNKYRGEPVEESPQEKSEVAPAQTRQEVNRKPNRAK